MIADLVVRGGTLVSSEGERRVSLAVADGRVAALDRDDAMPEARNVIDAASLHVLPGIIDTHVHVRDPGRVDREDWVTGTQAAAAGGITTILEMPIAIPPVYSPAILQDRARLVQPRSVVDFALYAGASGDNLNAVEALADAGAVAFKTFRTRATRERAHEFTGICCPDAGVMAQVMERTARTGLLHAVHAEEQQILDAAEERVRKTSRHDGLAHALARPEVAEVASVSQCISLAQATGARLQIAHMSAAGAVDAVARAKASGVRVTAETCPHYLTFTEEALAQFGPYAKCNPPLRSKETQDRLWEAVRSGVIDVIGTDHAPFLAEERAPFSDNIWGAPPGIPGLEEFVPIMLTAVARGRLALTQVVRLMSENPARLFGLWPRKGNLNVGADADMTIVDLRAERVHDHRVLYTKARDVALIYDGMRMIGVPVMTIVRGRVVMRDGKVVASPGWGRWVRPEAA